MKRVTFDSSLKRKFQLSLDRHTNHHQTMVISAIPEDDSVVLTNEPNRSRAHSHTRTNSSSSSASSQVHSPTTSTSTVSTLPLPKPVTSSLPSSPPTPPISTASGWSIDSTNGSTASIHRDQYQHTASEAAAVAALRNTVNSVKFNGLNRTIEDQDHFQLQSNNLSQAINFSHHGLHPHTTVSASTSFHGNKLSSVAASAAAFAARPKESALSKAKLFARQAKPHLSSSSQSSLGSKKKGNVDLTIQTKQLPPLRPTKSERSPLSRPSKELERIASIVSTNVLGSSSNGSKDNEKSHKHHIHFRGRKDSHGGVVLSSSSSNSKLVSEQGSIYSFHPSNPALSSLEMKTLGNKEDQGQISEDSWSLLCSKVSPLFSGEGLKVPVEDLNNLVSMHLTYMIQQDVSAREILGEFKDLLRMGIYNLDPTLSTLTTPDSELMPKLVDIWQMFFTQVVSYLEAVFIPLQTEFDCCGQILSVDEAKQFWKKSAEKESNLNIRKLILMGFRDYVIIPNIDRLGELISKAQLDFEASPVTEIMVRMLQCINILASIQSQDENQKKIDQLAKILRGNSLSRSRTGKDRRGFVIGRHPLETTATEV